MSKELCVSCRRPKATLNCELCQDVLCKSCAQFLEASTFSFLKLIPKNLTHSFYCPPCYDLHVAPALEKYNEVMERARNLFIFFDTQRKPIPIIKRSKEGIQVEDCIDRDETILRLAFLAAQEDYNAVVDAKVVAKKVRNEGYQKSSWQGSGVPAHVDAIKLERWLGKND